MTLRGQGYATHIYLDPKTPPNDLRYFPVRIGTSKVPAHNVVIEHLRYTGNDKAIGGGSIMGFNARLDEPGSLLLSCDNITVRHCWIYDAKQAAGCTKPATVMYLARHVIPAEDAKKAAADKKMVRTGYFDADRMATQFKNWQVHNNYIEPHPIPRSGRAHVVTPFSLDKASSFELTAGRSVAGVRSATAAALAAVRVLECPQKETGLVCDRIFRRSLRGRGEILTARLTRERGKAFPTRVVAVESL